MMFTNELGKKSMNKKQRIKWETSKSHTVHRSLHSDRYFPYTEAQLENEQNSYTFVVFVSAQVKYVHRDKAYRNKWK